MALTPETSSGPYRQPANTSESAYDPHALAGAEYSPVAAQHSNQDHQRQESTLVPRSKCEQAPMTVAVFPGHHITTRNAGRNPKRRLDSGTHVGMVQPSSAATGPPIQPDRGDTPFPRDAISLPGGSDLAHAKDRLSVLSDVSPGGFGNRSERRNTYSSRHSDGLSR